MWSRMTAEGAKAPSDCSRIVIRLRYGIKRRSDRRGNEHGSKGRGAGTVAWNRGARSTGHPGYLTVTNGQPGTYADL